MFSKNKRDFKSKNFKFLRMHHVASIDAEKLSAGHMILSVVFKLCDPAKCFFILIL
jgi:hypothetical protein